MNDTVSIADRAVKAIKEAEELRQAAINELTNQREEIDKKLAELGQTAIGQTADGEDTKGKKKNPCKVCGGTDHDGRAHRRSNVAPSSKQRTVQENEELPNS